MPAIPHMSSHGSKRIRAASAGGPSETLPLDDVDQKSGCTGSRLNTTGSRLVGGSRTSTLGTCA